jgi:hypothetical protein
LTPSAAVTRGSLRLLAAGAASVLIALALAGLGLTLLFPLAVSRWADSAPIIRRIQQKTIVN